MNLAATMMDTDMEGGTGLAGIRQWFSPLPKFDLMDGQATLRGEVQDYICAKFNKTYGANLTSFLPILLSLRCADNLSGVAGIGLARDYQPLFLEHYLDVPVEQEIMRLTSSSIERQTIAEVGNLVATTRGASRLVFIVLATALHRAGMEWMVFTATAPLITSLRRLGFAIEPIQPADPQRLPRSNDTDWGAYYEHAPVVVAGRLDSAMDLIASRTVYSTIQTLFQDQIDEVAALLSGTENRDSII